MTPKTFMLIAGEASGDLLAAELVTVLREKLPSAPVFFGAGGTKMSAAGVDLAFDMTQHAVTGITDVLKNILKFRRLFNELLALAIARKPDVIIGVDYGGFNLRFGQAIKKYVRENPFVKWEPKIIQFVSPQVWASRPGRANKLERDYDLLLSIFPFEKDWYAQRVPKLRVEFVGHPMLGRFNSEERVPRVPQFEKFFRNPFVARQPPQRATASSSPMLDALKLIQEKLPTTTARMVLPNDRLVQLAKSLGATLETQIGDLPAALTRADIAIASTGTVTMECAFFGVPTVTLYKTSWLTYQIARHLITVKSLTMPNLLAGDTIYPEFIQYDATPENLSHAALELLQDESRRTWIKSELAKIITSLGQPGAAGRAADAILSLFP